MHVQNRLQWYWSDVLRMQDVCCNRFNSVRSKLHSWDSVRHCDLQLQRWLLGQRHVVHSLRSRDVPAQYRRHGHQRVPALQDVQRKRGSGESDVRCGSHSGFYVPV